jgi:hypothetical protein
MRLIISSVLILFGFNILAQDEFDLDSLTAYHTIEKLIESNVQTIENDSITFRTGKFFNKQVEHKYIKFNSNGGVYICVFSRKDNYKNPILNIIMHRMNFIADSIFDINGDSTKDLAIHWYPSSGCCLADIYNCYIYNIEKDCFERNIRISNPTFYPKESKTYSMDYNHPGETIFYELHWIEARMDTLKSYSWKDRKQNIILIKDYKTGKQSECEEIPIELKKLHGFDWFTMKPYEPNE